jgi:deoxyinosine 3'endonuclease (endonuclease V)
LLAKLEIETSMEMPDLVAGVDVSYVAYNEGVATYALVEVRTGKLVASTEVRHSVQFPYISS